jgi:hypothetical protein
MNGVISFTAKLVLFQVHSPDFFIRDFPAGRVSPPVQTTGYPRPFGGCLARDRIDDRLIIAKRLDALVQSLGRFSEKLAVLGAYARGESIATRSARISPGLI